jgi:hypothetical protein
MRMALGRAVFGGHRPVDLLLVYVGWVGWFRWIATTTTPLSYTHSHAHTRLTRTHGGYCAVAAGGTRINQHGNAPHAPPSPPQPPHP